MRIAPTRRFLSLALAGIAIAVWIVPRVAIADIQLAQSEAEGEAARAAKQIEFGEEKKRQGDKQKARDTRAKAQEDLRLEGEAQRGARAGEATQRRSQRRSRFRAIINR